MNKQTNKKASPAVRLILLLIFPAVILLLIQTTALEKFSLIGYDFLFSIRGDIPFNSKILLIKQDEASTDFFNTRLSDWPRKYHARLTQKLTRAGADLIVFDYDFSRPSEQQDDLAFASAITESGNVILANRLLANGKIAQPLDILTENSLGEGFIDTILDKDGVWRKLIYMSQSSDGYIYFSLPMVTTEIYEDFPEDQRVLNDPDSLGWGSHQLPYPDMLINFSGANNTYPFISYFKVLEGDFDSSLVRGKIVLVGNTHRLGKDYFTVPTDDQMSGLEVHANAISSILDDRFILPVSKLALVILILLSGLSGGFIIFLRRPGSTISLLIITGGSGIIIFSAWYLFVFHTIWLDYVPLFLTFFLNFSVATAYQWRLSRIREKEIRGLFGHYVSKNVVDAILSENIPVQLEGHRTKVTILFSDIRGFTSISEKLSPSELGHLLNLYFDEMIAAVFQQDGTLDKLMGDAVMAFFGSPLEVTDHQQQACRCALEMNRRLSKLNSSGKLPNGITIEIGIGLHTGEAIVGNLGSSEFADYTVIGDTVNLASRIEGLNKRYATGILVSEDTWHHVKDEFLFRELDTVRVKGKEEPKVIYELLPANTPLANKSVELYEKALGLYRKGHWEEVVALLERNMFSSTDDKPALRLYKKCQQLLSEPPTENWDAITTLDSK